MVPVSSAAAPAGPVAAPAAVVPAAAPIVVATPVDSAGMVNEDMSEIVSIGSANE